MRYKINIELVGDIIVRVGLFLTFFWLNNKHPFQRHITPEELWLYKYPHPAKSYFPLTYLWIVMFFFPLVVFTIEYLIVPKNNDIKRAILSITLIYGLNGFLTSFFKVTVGRPRPDFYLRCFPDGVGDDITKCTGDYKTILDGRKSFPSGHASGSFACMAFMSLYLSRKLQPWNTVVGRSWKFCLVIFPIIFAAGIAVSRTCDYHHHYEDVICGSLLGSAIAYAVYTLYFHDKPVEKESTPLLAN